MSDESRDGRDLETTLDVGKGDLLVTQGSAGRSLKSLNLTHDGNSDRSAREGEVLVPSGANGQRDVDHANFDTPDRRDDALETILDLSAAGDQEGVACEESGNRGEETVEYEPREAIFQACVVRVGRLAQTRIRQSPSSRREGEVGRQRRALVEEVVGYRLYPGQPISRASG